MSEFNICNPMDNGITMEQITTTINESEDKLLIFFISSIGILNLFEKSRAHVSLMYEPFLILI